jgi:hypothetical protein
VRGRRTFEETCEDANRIRIAVDAGVDKLARVFERPVAPLRWKAGGTHHKAKLTLVSYFDERVEPSVNFYPLTTPDWAHTVAYSQSAAGLTSPAPGLYHATGLRTETGVLVPKQVSRLQDLRVSLSFRKYAKSFENVNGLLLVIERWHAARVLGDLEYLTTWRSLSTFGHRRQVLEGLVGKLFDCITSGSIDKVVAQASSNDNGDGRLRFLIRSLQCRTLEQGLIDAHAKCVNGGAANRLSVFRHTVFRYGCPGVSLRPSVEPLFEFALRLASAPETVRNWRKAEFESYLRELMGIPMLALAARIWVLLIAQHSEKIRLGRAGALYTGWDWT